jgi:hypothetical protein
MKRTHDAIVKACGKVPAHSRPPYGAIRANQSKHLYDTYGYSTIIWDVDPLDWKNRKAQAVKDRILAQTKSGSIILCHDIHGTTVDAMPATLDELKARGYQFATVSQLIDLEKESAQETVVVAPVMAAPGAGEVKAEVKEVKAEVKPAVKEVKAEPAAAPKAVSVP